MVWTTHHCEKACDHLWICSSAWVSLIISLYIIMTCSLWSCRASQRCWGVQEPHKSGAEVCKEPHKGAEVCKNLTKVLRCAKSLTKVLRCAKSLTKVLRCARASQRCWGVQLVPTQPIHKHHVYTSINVIMKERREYWMLLYRVLNVCGDSRAWNANNHCTSQYTCSVMLVYYLVIAVE